MNKLQRLVSEPEARKHLRGEKEGAYGKARQHCLAARAGKWRQHELAHWTSKGITVMGKQGQSFLWAASVGISMPWEGVGAVVLHQARTAGCVQID